MIKSGGRRRRKGIFSSSERQDYLESEEERENEQGKKDGGKWQVEAKEMKIPPYSRPVLFLFLTPRGALSRRNLELHKLAGRFDQVTNVQFGSQLVVRGGP